MRHPAVAGQFYAGSQKALIKQIEDCYLHRLGPGKLPSLKKEKRKIVGLVSPHAGYMYSGPIAAHGFFRLASEGTPESFVIIGPNHTGMGSGVSIVTSGEWETPLGRIGIDEKLASRIAKESDIIDVDEEAHIYEHSIEVQLPFIQHIFGSQIKFVPICMMFQDERTSLEVGEAIAKACSGSDVVVIASTDFTHYESQESAVRKDRMAIERILKLDARGLLKCVEENNITMCGSGPVAAMLIACEKMGAKNAELLKYATSGDVAGWMAEVVGYASIAILR
ncbi:MAG: AmmeMemoRadiSam system protein B [Candidatus Hadarchaeales archaeon]